MRTLREDGRFAVVGEAADGREATVLAEDLAPDLAVLDVRMPVLAGLQATKVTDRAPRTRVVLLSACDDDVVIRNAMAAGPAAYLTKDAERGEPRSCTGAHGRHRRATPHGPEHRPSDDQELIPIVSPVSDAHRTAAARSSTTSTDRKESTMSIAVEDLQPATFGDRVSWRALGPGADVFSADGRRVGAVQQLLAVPELDIFEGVVIDTRMGPGGLRYVDAGEIAGIHGGLIVLTVPAEGVHQLPRPAPAPAVLEQHAMDPMPSGLERRLARAWELISGK